MKAELLYIQKLTYDENTGNEIIGLFPSEYNPAIVSSYTYDAKRMGGAPTLTATIYSSDPLQWKKEEFVEYNGDRFFASYTPNSTKDNSSRMWKNEITFTSRRELLDNTLFFDVVVDDVDTQNKDRYRSNQTKFTFGGTIYEFVARINSSMAYCGLYRPTDEYKGYYVVVDEGYGTDEVKEVSFEDQYLTDVLQLINTTFELDYYWDGNVCHVGKVQHDLTDTPIKYGSSDALISVSKENANYKIVDMITGYGSSDNLPYYYPNDDEFGKADYSAVNFDKSLVKDVDLSKIFSWCGGEAYNKKFTLCKNTESKYSANIIGNSPVFTRTFGGLSTVGLTDADKTTYPQITTTVDGASASFYLGYIRWKGTNGSQNSSRSDGFVIASIFELDEKPVEGSIEFSNLKYDVILKKTFKTQLSPIEEEITLAKLDFTYEYYLYVGEDMKLEKCKEWLKSITLGGYVGDENLFVLGDSIPNMTQYKINDKCPMIINGKCCVLVFCRISTKTGDGHTLAEIKPTGSIDYIYEPKTTQYYWSSSDNKSVAIGNSGIDVDERLYDNAISANYTLQNGAWVAIGVSGSANAPSIVINGRIYTTPSQNLMPSIYRESGGAERFYYAKNDTYLIPGTSDHYKFVNLYKKGNPHQGSVTFDDIKPTINGIVNAEGQLFGEIADVAFDSNDSDVKDSDGKYIHNYFYIKLHKFNGDFGFDLFAHALASEPAKINLIKSNGCPACSFTIECYWNSTKNKCYNNVLTDGNGNLMSDSGKMNSKGDYILNDTYVEDNKSNQDSTKEELWIAVQKDTSTLGIIMPNASSGFKPKKGDLFVITGIKPPKVLVTAAEKRLDDALIKHMSENNTDQFNYSVKFSRIFLQENPDFASKLNENAKLSIQIQGDSDSDGNLISHEVFVSNYSVKVDNDELAEVEVELVNSLEVTKSDTKHIIDAVKGETIKSLSIMVGGSNANSFNASITDKMYLSKLNDDIANGKITFIKGLIAKGLADLMMGAKFGNNAKITELGEAVFSVIKSIDYDNAAEQGFSVEKEKNGKYHAFFTNLTIWGKAIFHELEVRKLSYSGGNIYLSGAGSKLIKVVPVKKSVSADGVTSWVETTEEDVERFGWKCYLLADDGTTATMNDWQEGDQARCQTMGEIAAGGAYSDVSNKSYWRTIPNGGVSTQNEKIYGTKTETYLYEDGNEQTREVQVELYDGQAFAWIVISKHCDDIDGYDDEFSVGYDGHNPAPLETRDIPSAGDTIVLDGNRHRNEQGEYDKTDRQNVIVLETTGEYAPRIACYANITEYKHTFTKSVNGSNKEVSLSVFETSPKGGTKINSSRFEWISDDGSTINIINYRGDWVSNNTYYHKNDQVNHNNAVWVCVANSGVDVTEEPSDGATYWKKVLSGGKGEKGDDAVSYSVSLMKELRTIAGHSNQSAVAVSFRKQEGSNSTVSGNIATFGDSASVKCYIDGERSDNMTDWINSGNDYFGYLNYEDAWTGKSVITVVMYIGDNIVASANFSLGQSGEGVVMAYKNATSRPSEPTVEDLSQLSDGWSRTPQKGGSQEKVSNISYGNYSAGNTDSGYSTSEWSEVSDGEETWRKSPAGLSDNGWALMKVSFTTNVDNSDVKFIIKAYSEYDCDFIQVHALDTEITGSPALRLNGVFNTSGNGIEDAHSFTSVKAGKHFFYVSYCKDVNTNSNGDYGLFRFDLSDNLASMPSTVWMSQAVLKEGKAVLPWSTPVQITGDDAYRVEVSPSTLVFDTNENGLVDTLSGKYATVTVYKGNQKISTDNLSLPSNYATKKCTNVDGSISNSNGEARITIDRIEQETISGDVTVSKSSGQISFPIDVLGERSTLMWVTVNVQVNVSKFTGSVAFDNKGYKAQFDELSKNAATKDELKDVTSTFEQTAREISLSVSEKSIGRRNLLVGSAFNRQEGFGLLLDANVRGYGILMNDGVDGMNCIKVASYYDGTRHQYCGAFWGGNHAKNIRIKHRTQYTFSCWVKVLDANTTVYLEVIYNKAEIGNDRDGRITGPNSFAIKEPNKWQLVKWSFTTDDTHDWIEANVFTSSNVAYKTFVASFCKPMLAEGDYNGWTLSQDDYDYIGGNMLDNTLSLDKSGSLYDVNGTLTPTGFGESTSIYKSFTYKLKGTVDSFSQLPSSGNVYDDTYFVRNEVTCYVYNGSEFIKVTVNDSYYNILEWKKGKPGAFTPFGLEANKDYVFSFMAKGTGLLTAYFYNPETDVFVESSLGVTNISVDGNANFQLTNKWERYWVHWRPSDSLHKYVLLRLNRSFQSDGSAPITDCYIAQPKLEEGAVVTEYTERKSDLIDKASMKKAGIEITSDQVILYGNKVQVKNPKENPSEGYDEAAMFQNGKINAQFINAGEVVAKGIKTQELEAQNLNVTGNSRLGIFEIHTSTADEDKRDEYTVNGDSIKYSGSYKFPDGKTEASGACSFLTYKPMFIRQGAPDRYEYMRLGHQFTEWDDGNISGGSQNYFFVGAAARYVCSGDEYSCNRNVLPVALKYNSDIKPAAYIYSVLVKDSAAFAIYTKAVGTDGERLAIQTNGAIRGVEALNVETIYISKQILSGIGAARCINTAEITIRLPINPVVGQKFYVLQEDTGKVNITGDSNHQIILFNKGIVTTCNSNTKGQISVFIWSGNYWFGSFLTGTL